MRSRLIVFLTVLVGVPALAVGCGGDDDGGDGAAAGAAGSAETAAGGDASDDGLSDGAGSAADSVTTSSLTKAQFVKRANAICRQAIEKRLRAFEAYLRENAEGKTAKQLLTDAVKESFMTGIEAESAKIAELGAPAGEEAEVEAILAAQQAAVDEVRAMETIPTAFAFEPAFGEATKLVKEYGIDACAHGS